MHILVKIFFSFIYIMRISLLLYSSQNSVTFPSELHIKNVRITKLQYQFLVQNRRLLAVQLDNPFNNNEYIDGLSNYNYCGLFPNMNAGLNLLNYTNESNVYDIKNRNGTYVTTINVNILIDGSSPGENEIGLSNPIFIEFEFNDDVLN